MGEARSGIADGQGDRSTGVALRTCGQRDMRERASLIGF